MNEDPEFIKDEIAAVYKRVKSLRLGGGPVMLPSTADEAFRKAAVICMQLNADPELYVKAQFAGCNAGITANFLHTDKAKDYYRIFVEEMVLSLDESYDVQKTLLHNQIVHAGRSVERALMHDGLDFEPWFRICITKEPILEVIQKYREEAKKLLTPKLKKFLDSKKLDYKRIKND